MEVICLMLQFRVSPHRGGRVLGRSLDHIKLPWGVVSVVIVIGPLLPIRGGRGGGGGGGGDELTSCGVDLADRLGVLRRENATC